jgi:integrase
VRWWDVEEDEILSIRGQVDRHGNYVEHGKTDTSLREVPIPRQWTAILERYKAQRALEGYNVAPGAYVFSTKTGRPLDQRNVRRELRRAQTKARTLDGGPTFPVL